MVFTRLSHDNIDVTTAGVFDQLVQSVVVGSAAVVKAGRPRVEPDPGVQLGGIFTGRDSGIAFLELMERNVPCHDFDIVKVEIPSMGPGIDRLAASVAGQARGEEEKNLKLHGENVRESEMMVMIIMNFMRICKE